MFNDATHFDNKGEILDLVKENFEGEENDNNTNKNKNNQELNEEIELKAVSPPRKLN